MLDNCCEFCAAPDEEVKVLELYSGIGGTRQAIEDCGLRRAKTKLHVVAIDINTNANLVYEHNFKTCKLLPRNIVSLTAEELDCEGYFMWTMSPPCQPFTRNGVKRDVDDHRCDSFLHLVTNVLPKLKTPPKRILLENVKGFEESKARQMMVDCLASMNYLVEEYLLTPLQIGIPNSRLRYYMIARQQRKPMTPNNGGISTLLPAVDFTTMCHRCRECYFTSGWSQSLSRQTQIKNYIEPVNFDSKLWLSEGVLEKFGSILDVVDENSEKSCCFTRAYGQYVNGTGSVLKTNNEIPLADVHERLKAISSSNQVSDDNVAWMMKLKLRYFSPKEIANLLCFPPEFSLPNCLSHKQQYKVLGNSVNVQVISTMLKLLLYNQRATEQK